MEDLELETSGSQPEAEITVQSDTSTPEDIEAIKAKNAQLYARLKKQEEENKALKAKIPQETSTNPADLQRLELKIDGYSDEEAAFIMRNGGKQALKDPLVTAAIEAKRQKEKSLEATPDSSSASPVFKQYSEHDLKNMPLEELQKIVPR